MIFTILIVTICLMLLVSGGYYWTNPGPSPFFGRGYSLLAVLLLLLLVLWLLGIGPGASAVHVR